MADALQEETADVLARLIQFNTVNPPGDERACQEWLRDYLTEAGLECELDGTEPERPNLVATLAGEQPGPVLGYLSHVDTVLADAEDWTHDPWSGEIHDGYLWGRGALDMKSQTAAEAVAAARLARDGWRPARGALKVFSVVDEETGGVKGAKWLCENRPDLARADYLLNEGAGTADAVRRPPAARRLLRGEGHVPLRRPRPRARRARLRARDRRQRAAQARARAGAPRLAPARPTTSPTSRARSCARSATTRTTRRAPSSASARSSRAWPRCSSRRWASPSRRRSSAPARRST